MAATLAEAVTRALQRVNLRHEDGDDLKVKLFEWRDQAFAVLDPNSVAHQRVAGWTLAILDLREQMPALADQSFHDAWTVADLVTRTLVGFIDFAGLTASQETALLAAYNSVWPAP